MNISDRNINLSSGYKMPTLGLGTWKLKDKTTLRSTIRSALKFGYRHFDTSPTYENLSILGDILEEAIEDKLIKRENLFITTKLWCEEHDDVPRALKNALTDLKMDYVDLYLIHFPVRAKVTSFGKGIFDDQKKMVLDVFQLEKTWAGMEETVNTGYARSIGICNFGIKNLTKLMNIYKIKPSVLQIETHPYYKQYDIFDFCKKHDIKITAYTIFGFEVPESNMKMIIEDELIVEISEKYKITPSQVIISYMIYKDVTIIPRSSNPSHIDQNRYLYNMSEEDYKRIDDIKTNYKYVSAKSLGPERFD